MFDFTKKQETESIRKEIEKLSSLRDDARAKLTSYSNAVNSTKLEKENIEKEIIEIEVARDKGKESVDKMKDDLDQSEQLILAQNKKKKAITNIISTLNVKKENLIKEVGVLELSVNDKIDKENEKISESITKKTQELKVIEKDIVEKSKNKEEIGGDFETISEELNTKRNLLVDIDAKIVDKGKRIESLIADIEELKKQRQEKEDQKTGYGKQADELREKVKDLKEREVSITDNIFSKKTDIKKFSDEADTKKEELNNLESKLFSIAESEKNLVSREAFIKAMFKRAGIPYR